MSDLTALLKRLESQPRDPKLLHEAGTLAEAKGNPRGAAELFGRLAEFHALAGQYLQALSLAKRVMTLDPGLRVHVQIRLSDWSLILQQPEEAAAYLRSAAELCRQEGRLGEASALEARLASMKPVT
jgi:tetratricopeptide (TPR) repeat protein